MTWITDNILIIYSWRWNWGWQLKFFDLSVHSKWWKPEACLPISFYVSLIINYHTFILWTFWTSSFPLDMFTIRYCSILLKLIWRIGSKTLPWPFILWPLWTTPFSTGFIRDCSVLFNLIWQIWSTTLLWSTGPSFALDWCSSISEYLLITESYYFSCIYKYKILWTYESIWFCFRSFKNPVVDKFPVDFFGLPRIFLADGDVPSLPDSWVDLFADISSSEFLSSRVRSSSLSSELPWTDRASSMILFGSSSKGS